MHLVVSLIIVDCLIYQEEELTSVSEMFLKLFPGLQNLSKIHYDNETCTIQSFKGLWVDILYNLLLSDP